MRAAPPPSEAQAVARARGDVTEEQARRYWLMVGADDEPQSSTLGNVVVGIILASATVAYLTIG
jgi:hypothetical protein